MRHLLFYILLLASLVASAQGVDTTALHTSARHRPRIGVVLSGGGAKGLAHVGVLRVLEQAGIPVDIIAGTSMGSIVGGLYSVGWNAELLDSLVRKQDWKFLFSDNSDYYSQQLSDRLRQSTYMFSKTISTGADQLSRRGGLLRGRNLDLLFKQLTQGYADSLNFNSLPIPFACVATDVIDNSEYVFHSGRLSEAMRASMAVPGVFTPVRMGEHVLVDGGLRNNYPVDVARNMGADIVIGVTLQQPLKTARELNSGMVVLGQIIELNCKNKFEENVSNTDIHIEVDTKGYTAASFNAEAIDSLVRRGEEAAMRCWPQLMALRRRLDSLGCTPAALLQPDSRALQAVDFTQQAHEWQRPVSNVMTGCFGVRFDSEEMVALQANGQLRMANKPFDLSATVRLGQRIMAMGEAAWVPRSFARAALGYTFRHNDIDFYNRGDQLSNLEYNHHQAQLSLEGFAIRNFKADLSARWDYYHYNHLLLNSEAELRRGNLHDDHFISYHATLYYDSENTSLFPTRGARFKAGFGYFTDNFMQYNNHTGFSELQAMWRISFALSPRLTLQPMLYGRLLFGSEIPNIRRNMIGGLWFGHCVEQQLPFAGLGHIQLGDREMLALQMQLQWQLTDNNFMLLKAVGMQQAGNVRNLIDNNLQMGYQLAYYYRTRLGPVGGAIGWAQPAKKVNLFVNVGFEF